MRDLVIRGGTVIDGTGRDKADVNVIDVDGLAVARPELVYDLPGGGKRLIQRARGYRHTLLSGVEVLCDDRATGALPGEVVRGARTAPD